MRPGQLAVEHREAVVNGVRLKWVEKGSGPLVLLLHGFPEFWWSWRYQLEPLARAGFRVVAPDLRGYNESGKQGPYDLDTLAGDVRALIAALGEQRATLVSHDWGGAVAWHLAAFHPEVVKRVAVLNCPHPAKMRRALATSVSQLRRSWYMFAFQVPWLAERWITRDDAVMLRRMYRAMAKDRQNFGDEEIAPFREAIQKPGAASATIGWYRAAFRRGLRGGGRWRYPLIEAPTLLIWAKDDLALGYEELVPGTEAYAPNLTVEPIAQCGHFVQAERPDEVNALLLRFLQAQRA